MKIQCDVCNKTEATLFCTADEAALCDACDHRVHHANKLASNHQRFSLHRPSSKQYPLCDICKEKRAFVFCQQDRAILCEECDLSIHSANEYTQKHNRFLLTGIKLSASAKLYSSSTTTTLNDSNSTKSSSQSSVNNNSHPTPITTTPLMANKITPTTSASTTPSKAIIDGAGSTITSSISEYLMETLPGWQVEDFLDSPSVPFSFYKSDDMLLPMFDANIQENLGPLQGIWVPQASPPPLYFTEMDKQIENKGSKEGTNIKGSNNRSRLRDDNNFIVPKISPDSNTKRPRFLW